MFKRGIWGLGALGALAWGGRRREREARCCGIIGYVGMKPCADEVLCQGIELLQNRGYDSAGLSTLGAGGIMTSKLTSNFKEGIDCIKEIKKRAQGHGGSRLGIAHTRWATCGERTDRNSHPHLDEKNRVALVHNGTIFNYLKLKNELLAAGHKFRSETDSEVIAVMIGSFLDQGKSVLQAIELTTERLEGTWGIVLIASSHPNSLFCSRRGSPLIIGVEDHSLFIASEAIAFQAYTNKMVRVKENECIEVALDNDFIAVVKDRLTISEKVDVKLSPSPGFDCFFLEEIYEQPEAAKRATGYFQRLVPETASARLGGFDAHRELALKVRTMLFVASGTSYHAALYGVSLLRALGAFDAVYAVVASEFEEHDVCGDSTGVVLLTQSGETADVLRAAKSAKARGAICIGVSNVVGSMITTVCDFGVFINSGREVSVAASKSFTCMMTVMHLIALWYSHHRRPEQRPLREKLIAEFPQLPGLLQRALDETRPAAQQLAPRVSALGSLLILGKGEAFAIAREGALKIKEITYVHAEAIQAGEIKHGPIALIDSHFDGDPRRQTHVLLIVIRHLHLEEMKLAINEVKSRLAFVIVVTDCAELLERAKIDCLIELPRSEHFAALLATLPLQLLTYEVARLKQVDIDRPRNLAKAVTVL